MGKAKTDKIVREFVKRVKGGFGAEKIIFFGSRARGDHLATSDYDFIVVSGRFRGIHFLSRPAAVYRAVLDLPASFDIICYTPEEFERKKRQLGMVREAVMQGTAYA